MTAKIGREHRLRVPAAPRTPAFRAKQQSAERLRPPSLPPAGSSAACASDEKLGRRIGPGGPGDRNRGDRHTETVAGRPRKSPESKDGEQESKLLFAGPTPQAIHEAQRRCMLEDVAAILGRQFDKDRVAEVTAMVNDLFDRDWKEKAAQPKKPERAFESYTKPSRKNLH